MGTLMTWIAVNGGLVYCYNGTGGYNTWNKEHKINRNTNLNKYTVHAIIIITEALVAAPSLCGQRTLNIHSVYSTDT